MGAGCAAYLPMVLKNYPPIYLFETFEIESSGWEFYTSPALPAGVPNSYVYLYELEGLYDTTSLYISEGNDYTGGARKTVNVPVNSTLSLSFWCKRIPGATGGIIQIRIDTTLLSKPICGQNWGEHVVPIPASYTDDGQVSIDIRVEYSLFEIRQILVDNISLSAE